MFQNAQKIYSNRSPREVARQYQATSATIQAQLAFRSNFSEQINTLNLIIRAVRPPGEARQVFCLITFRPVNGGLAHMRMLRKGLLVIKEQSNHSCAIAPPPCVSRLNSEAMCRSASSIFPLWSQDHPLAGRLAPVRPGPGRYSACSADTSKDTDS